MVAAARRRPREVPGPPGALDPGGRGRLLAALPVVLVATLAALRLVPGASHAGEIEPLYERASRAYAAERWEDAAEYARHAAALLPSADPRRAELLCVRGEALLRAGHAREAVEPFTLVVEDEPGPHRPQALHSGALAREAAGDAEGAAAWRRQLREEYPETPWAHCLEPPAEPSPRP
jgi:tetratricopeptide (TPR) repeat protein